MDCAELLENGVTESGVHTVYPRSRLSTCKSIDVYCDMETDGGGWTEEAKTNEEAAHSTEWKYERKTSAPELGSLPEDLIFIRQGTLAPLYISLLDLSARLRGSANAFHLNPSVKRDLVKNSDIEQRSI
ncbi:hypothetical protein AVEN_232619-1 [Araneus ventricosus]|uniref:Fibrinogen C-terminal domain-containing protein n=1 Tax=Araneus ventricosus TaxID=182803 RepID=A0A4Y2PNC7_ARAVE|nr:hypothetical protein AVEN_3998-1 [Araneus ventricosus]GBN52387.1 hypothetical protein AVEN_232619-1 [Araneus ventricosus]